MKLRRHGAPERHREAHCNDSTSPYWKTGYNLAYAGDELVEYKKAHFPDDTRRILACGGTSRSTVRVQWLPPAAPGVDVKWETQLYGMVLAGFAEEAVRFLQKTRNLSTAEAKIMVAKTARDLGMI